MRKGIQSGEHTSEDWDKLTRLGKQLGRKKVVAVKPEVSAVFTDKVIPIEDVRKSKVDKSQ